MGDFLRGVAVGALIAGPVSLLAVFKVVVLVEIHIFFWHVEGFVGIEALHPE